MSIARTMTKRFRRDVAPTSTIDTKKISAPVALISTTNRHLYDAPDVSTYRNASNGSTMTTNSSSSADDSDHSVTRSSSSSNHSRETLTDASSVDSSPISPKPNHLSDYFRQDQMPKRAASTVNSKTQAPQPRRSPSTNSIAARTKELLTQTIAEVPATLSSPAIPKRALSHSKRAHERVANKRSLQNMTPPIQDPARLSREHRSSADMFSAHAASATTPDADPHPFGAELEQLNEVAEEFTSVTRDAEAEADRAVMARMGLGRFCATDYLSEIQPLFAGLWETRSRFVAPTSAWI